MLGEVIDRGQLGIGSDDYEQDVPTKINDISNIEDIYVCEHSIYAITQDGSLYARGNNEYYGQLGIGNIETKYQTLPTKIENLNNVDKIYYDSSSRCAKTKTGEVYAWGRNYYGQLGIGNTENQSSPIKVNGITNVEEIYRKGASTFAKTNTGEVYAWGKNNEGQLGIGNKENQNIPVKVSNLSNVDNIYVCFGGYGFAQLNSGEVYAWGKNDKGQLGIGNTEDQSIPVKINELANVEEIYMNSSSIYAKTKTGEVYAWGENDEGQLGLGNTENQNVPTKIEGLPNVANFLDGAIITSDGKLYSIRGKDYLPELITLDGKLYNNGEYVEGIGEDCLEGENYIRYFKFIYSTNNVYINLHSIELEDPD